MVHADSTSPTTATADVTPPASGGPWAKYALRVCLLTKGVIVHAVTTCTTVDCSPVVAPPGVTTCPLTGLDPDTEYNVTATAVMADGTASKTSAADNFWTPTDK